MGNLDLHRQGMTVRLCGIGAWGPGFASWPELAALLASPDAAADADPAAWAKGPKPAIIPANERRRAPLSARLAVETSWQAVQAAGRDASDLPCIFASGYGDTDVMDYMCRALATEEKLLSPTRFHNSVFNAAAGYWTISTGCTQAANSVAGLDWTLPMALLEAVVQCRAENRPLLLTLFDVPVTAPLTDLFPNRLPFSLALVLAPVEARAAQPGSLLSLRLDAAAPAPDWPSVALPESLRPLYEHNPAGRALALLAALRAGGERTLTLPCNAHGALRCTLAAGEEV